MGNSNTWAFGNQEVMGRGIRGQQLSGTEEKRSKTNYETLQQGYQNLACLLARLPIVVSSPAPNYLQHVGVSVETHVITIKVGCQQGQLSG